MSIVVSIIIIRNAMFQIHILNEYDLSQRIELCVLFGKMCKDEYFPVNIA